MPERPRRAKPDPASHIGFLDEVEDRKKRRRDPKKDADGLDLDRLW